MAVLSLKCALIQTFLPAGIAVPLKFEAIVLSTLVVVPGIPGPELLDPPPPLVNSFLQERVVNERTANVINGTKNRFFIKRFMD